MTVNVVMSRATRVPGRNLALFNCRRQPTTYRGPFVALTITTKKNFVFLLFIYHKINLHLSSVNCFKTSPTI
jgi:hypothetical protein